MEDECLLLAGGFIRELLLPKKDTICCCLGSWCTSRRSRGEPNQEFHFFVVVAHGQNRTYSSTYNTIRVLVVDVRAYQ
jgi:hypothetical protein